MRILLITSCLDDGGAEKWMLNTVQNMDLSNVHIDYYFWFLPKNDRFVPYYEKYGVNLFFRNLKCRIGKPFGLKHDFKQFIKNQDFYDAIHINGTGLYEQMIILSVAQRLKIPVRIVHSHNAMPSNSHWIKAIIKDFTRKQIIKKATIVGGCSELATVVKYGLEITKSPKYHIFKNGIDLSKYSQTQQRRFDFRKKLTLESSDVFLHIGRFEKQKNHIFLLEIFSEILKHKPNAKLILIGHGNLEKEIFDKAKDLKLEGNILHISHTEKTEIYYSVADVFLLPSLFEGLPFVLLEAQTCGIPCVISDAISSESKVNDNVVSLSLKDSASKWADEAISMIGNNCTTGYENMLEAGYDLKQTAEDFLLCCKGEK